jgi:hypothetical protein
LFLWFTRQMTDSRWSLNSIRKIFPLEPESHIDQADQDRHPSAEDRSPQQKPALNLSPIRKDSFFTVTVSSVPLSLKRSLFVFPETLRPGPGSDPSPFEKQQFFLHRCPRRPLGLEIPYGFSSSRRKKPDRLHRPGCKE